VPGTRGESGRQAAARIGGDDDEDATVVMLDQVLDQGDSQARLQAVSVVNDRHDRLRR